MHFFQPLEWYTQSSNFPIIFIKLFQFVYLQVEAVKSGLHASLLVRHPETNELYVNFDPQILTLIRETECMSRLGLDIPLAARALRQKQQMFKEHFNKLQVKSKGLNSWIVSYFIFFTRCKLGFEI